MDLNFQAGGYIQIDIPAYELSFKDFDIEEEYRDDWDALQALGPEGQERRALLPRLLHGQPSRRGQLRHAERAHRHPAARHGRPPRHLFQLHLQPEARRQGHASAVPTASSSPRKTDREMVYIGGGAGMAPMRSHIFDLFQTLKTDRKVSFWYGGRSMRELFYTRTSEAIEKEFPNFSFHIALSEPQPEDNWDGPDRLHPQRGPGELPQGPRGPHRDRVLPVRPAADDRRRQQDALRPRRREGDDRLRRVLGRDPTDQAMRLVPANLS